LLINYTRKPRIETNLTLQDIFFNSEAKYKICYKNDWVFFSPEIFVKIKDQKISTFPMKGTIDANIPDAKEVLRNNPKEKAEHYT
ncbi:chorismate-binding protein, partial [Escherichia coli]|nr:chorismate-binding protein [Escherichia coli]